MSDIIQAVASKVQQAVSSVIGNILYNGEEYTRDDKGAIVKKGGKAVMRPTQNCHLVVFDKTIRGGMTDKVLKNDDGTPVKYSHCATIPINVAEVLAKIATACVVAGEPEAFAKVLTELCEENRKERAKIDPALLPGRGTKAAAKPVFLPRS